MFTHRFCLMCVLCWGLALSTAYTPRVQAQESSDSTQIADVIAEALEESPRVLAARLSVDTRRERATIASALPDPVLSLGLMNRPFDLDSDQAMTMNQLQLSQRLPWSGKRSSASEREERLTDAAELDAHEVAVSVVERVRSTYYRLAFIDRAIEVMEQTHRLLADLQRTALTQYEVGNGAQQDVLRAQVAQARMDADIRVMQQHRIAAAARFNGLLGRSPDDSVEGLALPEPGGPIPDLEELIGMAERRPAVRAARARVEAAAAQRQLASLAHLPDVNVTLGYSQRSEFADLFTLMVGVPLPVRRGSVQEPRLRESEASQALAEAAQHELYNETYAQLAERRADAARAVEVSEVLRTDILPQAVAAVQSGLSSYRVGSLDFMAVLESRMLVNEFEVERLRLAAEYQSALAAIDALIGVIPGGDQ